MAILSARDGRAWSAVARRAAPAVEAAMDARVLANRVVGRAPRIRLEALGTALDRARTASRDLAHGAEAVLRTDVAAFYPSVDPATLTRCLRRVGVEAAVADRAADLMEGWSGLGYPGLPIGPPGSAVLANAVLAAVDDRLTDVRWLRWVDDYLIALSDEAVAPAVIDRLDEGLDAVGLRRSEAKTVVVPGVGMVWPGGPASAIT
jgi:Reverse transcriptase (RNA-dependent DNA polymerase)